MGRFTTRHNGYGRKGSMKVIHLSKPASVIFIIIGLAFVALGAYFAGLVAAEVGGLVCGKTKLDIIPNIPATLPYLSAAR